MAKRHKAALKQARHSVRRKAVNKASKTRVKTTIKSMRSIVQEGKKEDSQKALPALYSVLDRMSRRGTLHKNAAARLKSRLTKKIAALK